MVFIFNPLDSLLMAIITSLYHENGMKYSWIYYSGIKLMVLKLSLAITSCFSFFHASYRLEMAF